MVKMDKGHRRSKTPVKSVEREVRSSVTLKDITEEDKQMAQEVWIQVESNLVTLTKQTFTELFSAHPNYKRFFKNLIHEDGSIIEDAWLTPEFERHMTQVLMPSLSRLIKSFDDLDGVEKQMVRLGRIHREKAAGLKRHHVDTLKTTLVKVLKEFFGPDHLPAHQAALKKLFSAAFCIFQDQL